MQSDFSGPATPDKDAAQHCELTHEEQLAILLRMAYKTLARYGLSAVQCTLLQYESHAIYRILTIAGDQYVLRVATPDGRTEAEQRSEMNWLAVLRHRTSLMIPEPVPTIDGNLAVDPSDQEGNRRYPSVLLRWIPGKPLNEGVSRSLMEHLGKGIAEVHQCSERFVPPTGFTRPSWTWERLFGARSIIHDSNITSTFSAQQHAVLRDASERMGLALLSMRYSELSYGLIHGDLHRDNILICEDSTFAVIDFDDCGFGYHLYDIACLLDSLQRRVLRDPEDYQEGKTALLQGYQQVRSLSPGYEPYLSLFMAFRDVVLLDFILRSRNLNVQRWGRPRVASLINQLQSHLQEATL